MMKMMELMNVDVGVDDKGNGENKTSKSNR